MTQPALEIVSFRLAPDASRDSFLAAISATYPLLAACRGHRWRRLVEQPDSSWTEVLEWDSMEDAQAASQSFMQDPAARALMALIDPDSVTMRHAPVLMARG